MTSARPVSKGLPVNPWLQEATRTAPSIMRSMPQPMTATKGASTPKGMASTDSTAKGMMTRLTTGRTNTLPMTPSGAVCWKW
mgnify:CR=1 FL=1